MNAPTNKPIITGSIAYDRIYKLTDSFAGQLPHNPNNSDAGGAEGDGGDRQFSLSYFAESLQQNFGGCAANIAFTLHQLGVATNMVAAAGKDFALYQDYLQKIGINTDFVGVFDEAMTAEACIFNDSENNQFTTFYPGASVFARQLSLAAMLPAPIAIVSPNDPTAMVQYCHELHANKTPFIFDPGQALSAFSREDCIACINAANYLILNDDEFNLIKKITQLNITALRQMVDGLIVTAGAAGSCLYWQDNPALTVPAYQYDKTVIDTTGCGDAYRAGVIYGMVQNWEWHKIIQYGSVVAGIVATHHGGQSLAINEEEVAQHFSAYLRTFS